MTKLSREPLIVIAEALAAIGALALGIGVSVVYAGVLEFMAATDKPDDEPDDMPDDEEEADEAEDEDDQEGDDDDDEKKPASVFDLDWYRLSSPVA